MQQAEVDLNAPVLFEMESEASAKRTARPSPFPGREETLLFPREARGLHPALLGTLSSCSHHLAESDAGERTNQSKEPASLYKFGNLEFLQKKKQSLLQNLTIGIRSPSAQQEMYFKGTDPQESGGRSPLKLAMVFS